MVTPEVILDLVRSPIEAVQASPTYVGQLQPFLLVSNRCEELLKPPQACFSLKETHLVHRLHGSSDANMVSLSHPVRKAMQHSSKIHRALFFPFCRSLGQDDVFQRHETNATRKTKCAQDHADRQRASRGGNHSTPISKRQCKTIADCRQYGNETHPFVHISQLLAMRAISHHEAESDHVDGKEYVCLPEELNGQSNNQLQSENTHRSEKVPIVLSSPKPHARVMMSEELA
mmetsp:Transcript_17800/g.41296  ORF Transcript_17800/g.41296 Transcript_17800/m.41296 type:complete len:231 (+) Transcript_17800:1143-1835(+)